MSPLILPANLLLTSELLSLISLGSTQIAQKWVRYCLFTSATKLLGASTVSIISRSSLG